MANKALKRSRNEENKQIEHQRHGYIFQNFCVNPVAKSCLKPIKITDFKVNFYYL